jgi:DNA-directed RNA polymerase specialized sigma24 family protein
MDIKTPMKSYLYRMAHNACLNKIKQKQIQSGHHQLMVAQGVTATNDVENTVGYKELQLQVEHAVASLPMSSKTRD